MIENIKKDYKKLIYYIFLITTIILAVYLRTKFFLADKPFWLDECMLGLNVLDRPIAHFFETLQYDQAAPPLFLLTCKLFTYIIPDIELALRTFPFICSLLCIPTFFMLSLKFFKNRYIGLIALIIFSLNYTLIFYCQEFKQYSSDVLFSIIIFLSYFYIDLKKMSVNKLFSLGTLYAVCPWFSYPSIFTLGALFLILLLKNKDNLKKIFILTIPFIISFCGLFMLQHDLNNNENLHNFWLKHEGFLNKDFSNLSAIFYKIILFYFQKISLKELYLLLFLLGLIHALYKTNCYKYLYISILILIILTASYLQIYPFADRISLYFYPFFVLLAVTPIEFLYKKYKKIIPPKMNYLAIIIYCIVSIYFFQNLFFKSNSIISKKKYHIEDIETLMNIAYKTMNKNDVLYVTDYCCFTFYQKKLDYEFKNIIIDYRRVEMYEYLKKLDNLQSGRTYYLIISHYPKIKKRIRDINTWAKKQDNHKAYTLHNEANALIIFTKK